MCTRISFIEDVMKAGIWASQAALLHMKKTGDIDGLKDRILVAETKPEITPDEYYNFARSDSDSKFDSLPLRKRQYYIMELGLYFKAKQLYNKSFGGK